MFKGNEEITITFDEAFDQEYLNDLRHKLYVVAIDSNPLLLLLKEFDIIIIVDKSGDPEMCFILDVKINKKMHSFHHILKFSHDNKISTTLRIIWFSLYQYLHDLVLKEFNKKDN